jgi:hypothetical protein
VRMHNDGKWRPGLFTVVVAALKPAIWTGEHHLRHCFCSFFPWTRRRMTRSCATKKATARAMPNPLDA